MLVTVAVCTWNRCETLRRTLDAMTGLEVSPGMQWELLAVNNNCQDGTDDVIRSFSGRLPIRLLHEPKLGLSNARNCAIAASAGEYIVWTDDDVIVDAQWLSAYHKAFVSRPDAAFFGGPIEPFFDGAPPVWVDAILLEDPSLFASRDFGKAAIPLTEDTLPFGANYAVRSREQKETPYDPGLGSTGKRIVCGEELAVLSAILRNGGPGWWVPEAKVRHLVIAEKLTIEWIRTRFYANGMYSACHEPNTGFKILGRPWRLWPMAAHRALRFIYSRCAKPPESWVRDAARLSWMWGRLKC